MRRLPSSSVSVSILIFSLIGCHHQRVQTSTPAQPIAPPTSAAFAPVAPKPAETATQGQTTVVWISMDGMRFDYLRRIRPPFLTKLAAGGAFTTQETPIVPSLTFPNHTAQVTGFHVDVSGIPMNAFYDSATGKSYSFPDDCAVIRATPIWNTATHQGVRTAVIGWPMSQKQTGPDKAAYFDDGFDSKITDQQRLDSVVQILNNDHADKPLRLVITYVYHADTIGHKFGPDSPELADTVNTLDGELEKFCLSVVGWFNATHSLQDDLVFLFTTDHGMETVDVDVNMERLLGGELAKGTKIVTSGPMATITLTGVPEDQKAERVKQILAKLKEHEFLSAWPSHELPKEYHFDDPSRVGDVVVLLLPGSTFISERLAASQPHVAGPKGMHGYDPAIYPNMEGMAVVWRFRHQYGGKDLGPVDNTQWQATVCKLLGIEPAKGSDPRAVALPQ